MTSIPPDRLNAEPADALDTEALLLSLRRKEGTWFTWGQACQQLQKAGYTPQQIFEATGFEPVQQNQVIVAAQVYHSILNAGASETVLSRFERTGSDTLYEFRILNHKDRAAAAQLVVDHGIDSEGSYEVAKALKEFSRLSTPPEAFPDHPADAVAYFYWKLARQQADLQARSRLIALGLRFASSESARKQIESLLTDFTVSKAKKAPLLPIYRLDSETEVPRMIPVAGKFPLTPTDLKAVPLTDEEGPFRMVRFAGEGAWVAVPGWQVIFASEDPVAMLVDSDQLPELSSPVEEVLVVIDRGDRQWSEFSYYAVDRAGQIEIDWFSEAPTVPILGRVVLVMRPKKVLDEAFNKELWQVEE